MIESQNHKVLNYLRKHATIDPIIAEKLYKIKRLASRMMDLKYAGYKTSVQIITNKKRRTRWAEYSLIKKGREAKP